jgi:sortase A
VSTSADTGGAQRPRRDWYWFLGRAGQLLIATGVILFLFVGYQLWGTGIEATQAQSRLQDRFEETSATAPAVDAPDDVAAPITIESGEPIAILRIPAIGVEKYVVEGVEPDDLKKGPGHYPHSVQPGRLGNVAVAGPPTTYGEPFRNLDELDTGDEITVLDAKGREFVYLVTDIDIVAPTDTWVVTTTDPDTAVLTLTTCHPEYSAKQRLVVSARLDTERTPFVADDAFASSDEIAQSVAPPSTAEPMVTVTSPPDIIDGSVVVREIETFDAGWFSDASAWPDLAIWLAIEIAFITIGWRFARRRSRGTKFASLAIGALPALVFLYFVFQNVSRLLPPNL